LLWQGVSNVLINAMEAIEKQGEIKVRIKVEEIKMPAPQKTVILEIQDNGCGIEVEILPQIFNPFFTTKEPGKGTGLGLSSVYMILERHNGEIKIDSKKGEGTRVAIKLPMAEA